MNTLLLFLLACEDKNADDTGFFDIVIDDTDTNNTDTEDTSNSILQYQWPEFEWS